MLVFEEFEDGVYGKKVNIQTAKKKKEKFFLKKGNQLRKRKKEPCSQRCNLKVKTSNMMLSKGHLWALDVKILQMTRLVNPVLNFKWSSVGINREVHKSPE